MSAVAGALARSRRWALHGRHRRVCTRRRRFVGALHSEFAQPVAVQQCRTSPPRRAGLLFAVHSRVQGLWQPRQTLSAPAQGPLQLRGRSCRCVQGSKALKVLHRALAGAPAHCEQPRLIPPASRREGYRVLLVGVGSQQRSAWMALLSSPSLRATCSAGIAWPDPARTGHRTKRLDAGGRLGRGAASPQRDVLCEPLALLPLAEAGTAGRLLGLLERHVRRMFSCSRSLTVPVAWAQRSPGGARLASPPCTE